MATPGWYPDPAGRPGAFRYWDGQAWGADLSEHPYAAPPGGVAPSTAPGFQSSEIDLRMHPTAYGAAPTADQGGPTGPTTAQLWLLLLATVVATAVVAVVTFFLVGALLDG